MLQIMVSVRSLQNGSRKAVSATGTTSMSDSLMAIQPRMLEPSKPRPSSKVASDRASAGMVKCCHRPGKSMKRRSTARTSFSRIRARTSLGVTVANLQKELGRGRLGRGRQPPGRGARGAGGSAAGFSYPWPEAGYLELLVYGTPRPAVNWAGGAASVHPAIQSGVHLLLG